MGKVALFGELSSPNIKLLMWQNNGFQHFDVGWKCCHKQSDLGDVLDANHWFLIGIGVAGIASLGENVSWTETATGDSVVPSFERGHLG